MSCHLVWYNVLQPQQPKKTPHLLYLFQKTNFPRLETKGTNSTILINNPRVALKWCFPAPKDAVCGA